MAENTEKKIIVPAAPPPIPHYEWRREELRKLLRIPTDEFLDKYRSRALATENLHQLYEVFAELLAQEVEGNNRQSKSTRIILPVGPTGQYPIFLRIVIESKLSLQDCHFFFMDEYCHEDGRPLGPDHPFGFRSTMEKLLLAPLEKEAPDLMIPREQVHFPNPS